MFRALQCPSSGARQTAIAASGFRMDVQVEVFSAEVGPPAHPYGNQRMQRQFDGLLMMGTVMPKTCWAVSVQQGNKFYDCLLHLLVVLFEWLKMHGTTNLKFTWCHIPQVHNVNKKYFEMTLHYSDTFSGLHNSKSTGWKLQRICNATSDRMECSQNSQLFNNFNAFCPLHKFITNFY
jgi:hypothetical protein